MELIIADYHNPKHGKDILTTLNAYAVDEMGGGEPLSDYCKAHLIKQLQQQNNIFTVLCYIGDKAVGIANCVEGFSTFYAKPLINIHDLAVVEGYRGQGIGKQLIDKVTEVAKQKQCCKVTLEVLTGNLGAQALYRKCGFDGYQLDENTGQAMFWQKSL